ncbi:hypothetical protein ACS0TY_009505 [Phlomoides rotata]
MDSEEEYSYYSSGGEDVVMEEDSGRHDPYSDTKDYIILKEDEIKQLLEEDISEVSNVLSVSRGIACTLLLRENWKISSVVEKWLADDDGVREIIAVSETPKSIESDNYCKICFESVENDAVLSLPCGHPFCADCWRNYLNVFINDGPGCLNLHCPEPKCETAAGLDMVESVSWEDDRNKYYHYLYRSYIESSRNRKWCPAPGCEYAVEFDAASVCESYDVTCDCSYKFCWNCTEECHRPVDCQTVLNWTKKNKSDGANFAWISAYTKPCPKCKRPIEKNTGCNHMTCGRSCRYQFCWLCLEKWPEAEHRCNKYDEAKEADRSLENIRAELKRYSHYYERWASNHKSRDIALVHMTRAKNEHVPILSKVQGGDVNLWELCLSEAWEQIVECRRVLKWTYAYGFYMDVGEAKKTFFEYLQGEAESALERLHHSAETEIEKYVVEADEPCVDFIVFRSKLMSLTGVTRTYFENLVRAMESNLCEVEDQDARSSRCKKQEDQCAGVLRSHSI